MLVVDRPLTATIMDPDPGRARVAASTTVSIPVTSLVPVRFASHPHRRRLLVGVVVAASLALALDAVAAPAVRLDHRSVRIHSVEVHGAALVDAERLGAEVGAAIDRYLDVAVVQGLTSGRPGSGLGERFTAPARTRLHGPDRASLVEEGGQRPAVVFTRRARADLVALVAPSGQVEVVVATIDHRVKGWGGAAGSLTLKRTGDLVLNREGGEWRIDAYDLAVDRRRDPLPPLSAVLWVFA